MATEQESREQLVEVVGGALAAYDAVVAERDAYKEALENADADKAQAVADANAANDAGDAEFNLSQVDRLRQFQANPEPTA